MRLSSSVFTAAFLLLSGLLYAEVPEPEHQSKAAAYLDSEPLHQYWTGRPDEETARLADWIKKQLPPKNAAERAPEIAETFMRRTGWNGIRAQGMTIVQLNDQAYRLKRICYAPKYKQIGFGWELFDRVPRNMNPMLRMIPQNAVVAFGSDLNGPGIRDFLFSFIVNHAPEFLPMLKTHLKEGLSFGYDWTDILCEIMGITVYLERTPGQKPIFGAYTGCGILLEMNTPTLFDSLANQFQKGLQNAQREEKLLNDILKEEKIQQERLDRTKKAIDEEKKRIRENRKQLAEGMKKKQRTATPQEQPETEQEEKEEEESILAEFDFDAVEQKLRTSSEKPEADVIRIPDSPFYFGWKNGCFFLTTTEPDLLFSRIDSISKDNLANAEFVLNAQKNMPSNVNGFFYFADPGLYGVVTRCPDGYLAVTCGKQEKTLTALAEKGLSELKQYLKIPFDGKAIRAFLYRQKRSQ